MTSYIPHEYKRSSGIYSIVNVVNGHYYIGSAQNLSRRYNQHSRNAKKQKHKNLYFQRAWNHYGSESFAFFVLEICPISRLIETEQQYLDRLRPFERGIGYNILSKAFSSLGFKMPTESIKQSSRIARQRKIDSTPLTTFYGPRGESVTTRDIKSFCQENNLLSWMVNRMIRGRSLYHNGWTLQRDMDINTIYKFYDPLGRYHEFSIDALKEFCQKSNLSVARMILLWRGEQEHYNGWIKNTNENAIITFLTPEQKEFRISKYNLKYLVRTYGIDHHQLKLVISGEHTHTKGWSLKSAEKEQHRQIMLRTPTKEYLELNIHVKGVKRYAEENWNRLGFSNSKELLSLLKGDSHYKNGYMNVTAVNQRHSNVPERMAFKRGGEIFRIERDDLRDFCIDIGLHIKGAYDLIYKRAIIYDGFEIIDIT